MIAGMALGSAASSSYHAPAVAACAVTVQSFGFVARPDEKYAFSSASAGDAIALTSVPQRSLFTIANAFAGGDEGKA